MVFSICMNQVSELSFRKYSSSLRGFKFNGVSCSKKESKYDKEFHSTAIVAMNFMN